MSCNYYAHIIPKHDRKLELQNAIEYNDFHLIKTLVSEMYDTIHRDWDSDEITGGVVHLGKTSSGWKFLWNPNIFVVRHGHFVDYKGRREWKEEPNTGIYLYPLTKQGLHDFIFREDVLIYDEYDELQDKETFWKMALEWGKDEKDGGWDAAGYEKWERENNNKTTLYPVTGELTDFLRQEGYKFTSPSNSDFYSDGLRFAGFTEFS